MGTLGGNSALLGRRAVLLLLVLGASCGRPDGGPNRSASPPPPAAAAVVDEATVEGTRLEILRREDACLLRSGGLELPLEPAAPCFFLRRDGQVQFFPYPEAKVDWVVIVAGKPVSEATRKTWNLRPGDTCGEQSQGVLRKGGELSVSRSMHSGGVYCRDQGVDEKEFWSFAHRP